VIIAQVKHLPVFGILCVIKKAFLCSTKSQKHERRKRKHRPWQKNQSRKASPGVIPEKEAVKRLTNAVKYNINEYTVAISFYTGYGAGTKKANGAQ
jgi:hypothetical protein